MTQANDKQAQHHKEMEKKRRLGRHEDAHASSGAVHVDLEPDRRVAGREEPGHGRAEDLPDQRAGIGLAAMRDGFERGALLRVGALVHDGHERAVPVVDRAGPGGEDAPVEAVERRVAEATALDVHERERAAIPVAR